MKSNYRNKQSHPRGYTLIETLVASAVIMLAVGAASSLSLALVTQEEMSERAVRAANYLENSATLYQLGMDSAEIISILPEEPVVTNLTFTPKTVSVTGLGNVGVMELQMTYKPSAATSTHTAGSWTGGEVVTRSHSIEVMRANP